MSISAIIVNVPVQTLESNGIIYSSINNYHFLDKHFDDDSLIIFIDNSLKEINEEQLRLIVGDYLRIDNSTEDALKLLHDKQMEVINHVIL